MQDRLPLTLREIVEVHMLIRPASTVGVAPKDSAPPVEAWIDAKVVHIDGMQIGVEFESGEKLALPMHMHGRTWRRKVVVGVATKWGTFTEDALKALKLHMDDANERGETQFVFQGGTWICSFVKYLLEYAESQGLKINAPKA